MRTPSFVVPLTLAATLSATLSAQPADPTEEPPPVARGLTAVPGVRVGHFTLSERPTGCTVIVTAEGAVAGVDVRGGAPGSRELALLDPVNTVGQVHAIVLSGGSAFGLDTASGVMKLLEERGIGFETPAGRVPIVPAAILFDLQVGDPAIRPGADAGYRAAAAAGDGPVAEGNVGAGAGASVGKLAGMERAMKSGLGSAALRRGDGLTVAALVAVNSLGDVVEPATGQVIAGVRAADGRSLADARKLLRGASPPPAMAAGDRSAQNTTIGVVATDARLTKAQATKVAQMAQDGLARAIYPSHTPWDGDTVFALATGTWAPPGGRPVDLGPADVTALGALAADVMAAAIVRAVRSAEGLPGLPAVRDLEPPPAP